jgi:hypothetical protein
MELTIKTFLYVFLHLCPLILVCFFTISSIFANDFKGLVFLAGLLFSICIIIIGGNGLSKLFSPEWNQWLLPVNPKSDTLCKVLSFGTGELSNLSIGQMVIGFSFFYLLTTILTREDDIISSNWPTITFFSLLMLAEILVNTNITEVKEKILNKIYGKEFVSNADLMGEPYQYCYHWRTSLFTYVLAGGLGAAYASIVKSWDTPELLYFGKYKNNEKCEKVGKKTFACRVFKNGSKSTDTTPVVAP